MYSAEQDFRGMRIFTDSREVNLGLLYLRGAIESKISEQEQLKREIRLSGLEECLAATEAAVETSNLSFILIFLKNKPQKQNRQKLKKEKRPNLHGIPHILLHVTDHFSFTANMNKVELMACNKLKTHFQSSSVRLYE